MFRKTVLSIPLFLCMFSCVTTKSLNYMQKPSDGIPNYVDTLGFSEYAVQKGDYLNIRVYSLNKEDISLYNCNENTSDYNNTDEASSRLCLYVVDEQGDIYYPYIGSLQVLGKTTRQIKSELEDMFKRDIAKYVSVDVSLVNRSFSVIGGGVSKRVIMPHDKVTIFQALAMVGDLPMYADRSKVKLVRTTVKGTVVKVFDLRTEKIINSEYYYIQPNDVIYIQQTVAKRVGVAHLANAISIAASTVSLGAIIYKFIFPSKNN